MRKGRQFSRGFFGSFFVCLLVLSRLPPLSVIEIVATAARGSRRHHGSVIGAAHTPPVCQQDMCGRGRQAILRGRGGGGEGGGFARSRSGPSPASHPTDSRYRSFFYVPPPLPPPTVHGRGWTPRNDAAGGRCRGVVEEERGCHGRGCVLSWARGCWCHGRSQRRPSPLPRVPRVGRTVGSTALCFPGAPYLPAA